MKQLLLLLLLSLNVTAQKIDFKDGKLKKALLELGYDFNKNNEIEISEIDTITKLKVVEKSIKNLDDLKYFKSLKSLNAMTNEIKNLDVFNNNSIIEHINIGDNLFDNKLTLRNIPNLKELHAFLNQIKSIEFTGKNNIKLLTLQGNQFETINFKKLKKLESLALARNELLKSIDIHKNVNLKELQITNTKIIKLDISKNPQLKVLYADENVELIKSEYQKDFKPAKILKKDTLKK